MNTRAPDASKLNPTPHDSREPLSGHMFRVTGDLGIIGGLERAARTLRERRRGVS